jgi:hypothetical protein
MKGTETVGQPISERWLELKQRALDEASPEILMAILVEVDEMLLDMTRRVALLDEKCCCAVPYDTESSEPEIGSQ